MHEAGSTVLDLGPSGLRRMAQNRDDEHPLLNEGRVAQAAESFSAMLSGQDVWNNRNTTRTINSDKRA
jgi:hypothetical protein